MTSRPATSFIPENQVASEGVFHHRDAGGANGPSQRQLDGKPGGVAPGVQDASAGVRGFEPTRKLSVVLIKGNAEAHQIAYAGRPLGAEHFHGVRMAQTGARTQGVGDVLGDAVVREHRGGNAALGEARVAVFQPGLGY